MNNTLFLVLFAFCVCASCFFSGSETALTTLSDAAVFRMKEKKHPEAARLERLRGHLPQTLSTLLIGNTLVNIAAGSIGTVLAIEALGERWGVVTATVVTTVLLLVFGEVTPKTLASLERDLGISLVEPEMETVAGFLLKKFERIPRTGARTWLGDTEFVVERASPRAIERIRITKKARAPEETAAEKA